MTHSVADGQLPTPAARLRIEVAVRWWSRLRGLLGRKPLAADEALLLRPCAAIHTAFMHYPIDVVFIDRHGRVCKVVQALPPWRFAGCRRARMTLELRAGGARHHRLHAGQHLAMLLSEVDSLLP